MILLTSKQHEQQVIVEQCDNAPSTLFKSYITILKSHLLNISSLVMESQTPSLDSVPSNSSLQNISAIILRHEIITFPRVP